MKPSEKLNIITGETGAGKTIMLGAVGLLLGNRADTKVLLDQSQKCIIEGTFDVRDYQLQEFFLNNDLDYAEECIIRREISPSSKSRGFVNDTPVNLENMKMLGRQLMDVHSQHDTLQLSSHTYQLFIVDTYAQNENLKENYKSAYQNFVEANEAFKSLEEQAQKLTQEADYNQFLYEELNKAGLYEGEQQELEDELKVLEHAEEIKNHIHGILDGLNHSEMAVNVQLAEILKLGKQLENYSDKFIWVKERLESSAIELKDLANEIEKADLEIEVNPDRIEETKNRLSLIYQLQQKHHVNSITDLLEIQHKLEEKVNQTYSLEENLAKAELNLKKRKKGLEEAGSELSKSRLSVFTSLAKEIEKLLKDLAIPDARLKIEREFIEANRSGIDKISFLFSANKGVPMQEVKDVASGGEFSRLMFCIKYLLADKTALPSIIFDEIDNGVSGGTAVKLGNMMKKMALSHQVITISHLPQIAAKGDAHYYVYKESDSDRSVSKIKLLSSDERIEEIAKMISGAKKGHALESAKAMLDE